MDIAKTFVTALRSSDGDLLKTILTDEAVWSLPGTSIISGEAKGAEAVVHRAKTIAGHGLHFELKHILIGHHGAALSLHNTARRGDLVFDEHLATVLSIRDGKVHQIDTYLADVEMLNAFFV